MSTGASRSVEIGKLCFEKSLKMICWSTISSCLDFDLDRTDLSDASLLSCDFVLMASMYFSIQMQKNLRVVMSKKYLSAFLSIFLLGLLSTEIAF